MCQLTKATYMLPVSGPPGTVYSPPPKLVKLSQGRLHIGHPIRQISPLIVPGPRLRLGNATQNAWERLRVALGT